MLTRTFLHIPTVGPKRERAIWRAGVHRWPDFLEQGRALLPPAIWRLGRPVVEASLAALESPGGLAELAAMIPSQEHWRFHPHCTRIAYLDIETGGEVTEWGGVTVVGVWDGRELVQYVAGKNMHEFDHALAGYEAVVTFAGAGFDLPVLAGVFPRMIRPPVHIDLRWALKRLGYTGGLKRIERQLGLERPQAVADMGGWDAVRLWRAHLAGQDGALKLLLAYNAEDVYSLEPLLDLASRQLAQRELARVGLA